MAPSVLRSWIVPAGFALLLLSAHPAEAKHRYRRAPAVVVVINPPYSYRPYYDDRRYDYDRPYYDDRYRSYCDYRRPVVVFKYRSGRQAHHHYHRHRHHRCRD